MEVGQAVGVDSIAIRRSGRLVEKQNSRMSSFIVDGIADLKLGLEKRKRFYRLQNLKRKKEKAKTAPKIGKFFEKNKNEELKVVFGVNVKDMERNSSKMNSAQRRRRFISRLKNRALQSNQERAEKMHQEEREGKNLTLEKLSKTEKAHQKYADSNDLQGLSSKTLKSVPEINEKKITKNLPENKEQELNKNDKNDEKRREKVKRDRDILKRPKLIQKQLEFSTNREETFVRSSVDFTEGNLNEEKRGKETGPLLTEDGDLLGFGSSDEEIIDEKAEEKKIEKYRANIFIDDCAISDEEEDGQSDEQSMDEEEYLEVRRMISETYRETKRERCKKKRFVNRQLLADDLKAVQKIRKRFLVKESDGDNEKLNFKSTTDKISKKDSFLKTRDGTTAFKNSFKRNTKVKDRKSSSRTIRSRLEMLSSESESEDEKTRESRFKKLEFRRIFEKSRSQDILMKSAISQEILSCIERKKTPKGEKSGKNDGTINFAHMLPKTQEITKGCSRYRRRGSLLKSLQSSLFPPENPLSFDSDSTATAKKSLETDNGEGSKRFENYVESCREGKGRNLEKSKKGKTMVKQKAKGGHIKALGRSISSTGKTGRKKALGGFTLDSRSNSGFYVFSVSSNQG